MGVHSAPARLMSSDNVGNLMPHNVTKDHAAKYRDRLDKKTLKPRALSANIWSR